MHPPDSVWIFVGAKARFPSGVFANVADAEKWIAEHRLTGVLTEYRVGVGAFDQALREGTFEPRDEREKSPEFIEAHAPSKVEYDGVLLLGRQVANVVADLDALGLSGLPDDVGVDYPTCGFGLYAPEGTVEGVSVYPDGYYQDG